MPIGAGSVNGQSINPTKLERAKHFRKNMTPAEKLLWQSLRTNRLNGLHFRRRKIISGFIVDFYCHAARLIVEVDGEIHQQQQESDRQRDLVLTSQDLQILRLSNEQVLHNLPNALCLIVEAGSIDNETPVKNANNTSQTPFDNCSNDILLPEEHYIYRSNYFDDFVIFIHPTIGLRQTLNRPCQPDGLWQIC